MTLRHHLGVFDGGRITMTMVDEALGSKKRGIALGVNPRATACSSSAAVTSSLRDDGRLAEQTVEIVARDGPLLATLLKQEASQSRLHQPVLIPLGMLFDEADHGVKQIRRELIFHTHVRGHRLRNLIQSTPLSLAPPSPHNLRPAVKKRRRSLGSSYRTTRVTAPQWICPFRSVAAASTDPLSAACQGEKCFPRPIGHEAAAAAPLDPTLCGKPVEKHRAAAGKGSLQRC
jgi:hypothetical protein